MGHILDHTVQVVRNLDATRKDFERLGFRPAPHVLHPSGATANYIFMLGNSFLEITSIVDETKVVPSTPSQFSFAHHNSDHLRRFGEGIALMAVSSRDVKSDYERCSGKGLRGYPPFRFTRPAQASHPDGPTVTFSLGFLVDSDSPRLSFFYFQQHTPENFWVRELQAHPNGAMDIAELTVVAEPHEVAPRLATIFDAPPLVRAEGDAHELKLQNGSVRIWSESDFRREFDRPAPGVSGPRFAALAVRVASISRLCRLLDTHDVKYTVSGDRVRPLTSVQEHGAIIEFIS